MRAESQYDWSGSRKIWHFAGCVLMIFILYLWKGMTGPVSGLAALTLLAWAETALVFGIDILRLHNPEQNESVKRLPFYGKLMRPVEENHFNATSYYLLGASILITATCIGWCSERTFVLSLVVLGVADPAAAWARHELHRRAFGQEIAFGLLAFIAASFASMWLVSRWLGYDLSGRCILATGIIVALVETYTKYGVALIRPVTRRVQAFLAEGQAPAWVFRLYPDDNLLIPLMVAFLLGILRPLT